MLVGDAPRGVVIIGATGSIGRAALQVVALHPERLRVAALAALSSWEEACQVARASGAEALALADPIAARRARAALDGSGIAVLDGEDGVRAVAAWPTASITLVAPTGLAGLGPVLAALEAGRDVALANKETLVAAGRLVTSTARRHGARLLPVDSEHSGIFQCLRGRQAQAVRRLWLTASGGPFLRWSAERLATATPEEALRHPTWRMGARVTIDSATLFNKGLEVIEASWLFGVTPESVQVLVHPQSVVHSLVEYVDGSFLAQCAPPDMRLPIAHALSYPEVWPQDAWPRLDLSAIGRLDFEPPDVERFPCLGLVREAARVGRGAPAAANAADEVAVARFLREEIAFLDIPRVVEAALAAHTPVDEGDLDALWAADRQARHVAGQWRARVQSAAQGGGR